MWIYGVVVVVAAAAAIVVCRLSCSYRPSGIKMQILLLLLLLLSLVNFTVSVGLIVVQVGCLS